MAKLIIVKPRTIERLGFVYQGYEDLQSLINFVGKAPQINEKGELFYKKHVINNNSVIFKDTEGNITGVMSRQSIESAFDLVAEKEYVITQTTEKINKEEKPATRTKTVKK